LGWSRKAAVEWPGADRTLRWSTGRLVQIIASALAGGLIALIGTRPAFVLNAVSFILSAALIARLNIPTRAGQLGTAAKRGSSRHLVDAQWGLRYALADRFVSRLLLIQSLASLAVGASGALLVVLAERQLELPPAGFAWLIAAIGVGALLGPLIPNALARDYKASPLVVLALHQPWAG